MEMKFGIAFALSMLGFLGWMAWYAITQTSAGWR
jgi:hypothetical protein